MVKHFLLLPCWRIVILLLACWPLRGGCSWLTKGGPAKSADSDLIGLVPSGGSGCSPKQAKCWCGSDEDRHVTVINVKQCLVFTSWDTLCEPCQKPVHSCAQLQHCARCLPRNPSAVCDRCPLDRHGLHCELESPCKTPNVSEHMIIHPRYTKRGVYKLAFRCTDGRVRHGPRNIKCKNDTATWNKDPPTCVFPARCADLPNDIPFTRVKNRTSDHVVLECDEGYVTSGKILQTTLQCEHGAWVQIGERVKCERSVCPELSVADGNVHDVEVIKASLSGFVSSGSRVKATCQERFTLQGPAEVNCSSGRWQPSVPRCVAQKCEIVQHGTKCSLNTPAGNTVFLSPDKEIYPGQVVPIGCKKGFFRKRDVGNPERICLFNGTLTDPDIVCDNKVRVCKIHASDDSHLRFCRRSGGPCTPGKKDHYRDNRYEFPDNVVPSGMYVIFGCDNEFYHLDSSFTEKRCNQDSFETPRCIPVCGKRHPPKDPYIAGGEESDIEAWPWQAALMQTDGKEAALICGATLIYDRWAVTAGHCVTKENSPDQLVDKNELRLVYGMSLTQNMTNSAIHDKEFQGQFGVSSIILHHQFNKRTLDHDIALIELKTPVEFNYRVGVACLPATLDCSNQRLVTGTKGVVTGWGSSESDSPSDRLRELTLYVANTTECEKHFKDQGYNTEAWTENMICAESNSTTEDTTDGDSGGPFVVQGAGTNKWVLEGIVSWGVHKNDREIDINIEHRKHRSLGKDPFPVAPNCPGRVCYSGYTRVAKYLDWIQEKTGRSTGERCA
uniref:Limulus clotting factor C-like n=1 Tax=Littorina littorea TaxID=31216 RepID=A0A2P1L4A7_LITLI|nr:limulus clotting factor C-like [Littorina littorea]